MKNKNNIISHRIPLSLHRDSYETLETPSKKRMETESSVVAILNFQNDHGNRFERRPRGAKKNVKFIQPPQGWATGEEGLY